MLAERYEGVRIALREQLEEAGVARVVAEAATVGAARAALSSAAGEEGVVLVAGLTFPDGAVTALLGRAPPTVVYSWLPADEHEQDLRVAAAVVIAPPLVSGLVQALRMGSVP